MMCGSGLLHPDFSLSCSQLPTELITNELLSQSHCRRVVYIDHSEFLQLDIRRATTAAAESIFYESVVCS